MNLSLRNPIMLAVLATLALFFIGSTFSIVPETRQGVVLRFGRPVALYNPYRANEPFGHTGAGLKMRVPLLDQVVWIDKRIQSVAMERQQVISADQRRLQVDAFARYRIVDPQRMYVSAGSEERVTDAWRPILGSALRTVHGRPRSALLLCRVRTEVTGKPRPGLSLCARQYGAEIVDVRIMRADLPDGTPLQSAFQRMRTARQQEALTIQAEGAKRAQIIRAQADADAAKIYAASFGKDPQFYDFYRAMQSYRVSFAQENNGETTAILSPDNDYLRQFRGR